MPRLDIVLKRLKSEVEAKLTVSPGGLPEAPELVGGGGKGRPSPRDGRYLRYLGLHQEPPPVVLRPPFVGRFGSLREGGPRREM